MTLFQHFHLEATVVDMSVDWISRTLYIVEDRDGEGHIRSYEIDKDQQFEVIKRPHKIGNIVLDPYTRYN